VGMVSHVVFPDLKTRSTMLKVSFPSGVEKPQRRSRAGVFRTFQ
jgi:hypothetical protein